jgi:predicted phosphodiesterase
MDIVIISDTHELHNELDVPPGDLLIHCGDWTMLSRSLSVVENFNRWLGDLPHAVKLVTCGNHELFLERDPSLRKLITNAIVLLDQAIEIKGLKIFGSPVTPLYGGAFGKSSASDRRRHWAKIPDDTHLLISHGPPRGVLDVVPGSETHWGDPELLARCEELPNLQLVCFGHIHGAYGVHKRKGILYVNAALMGPTGDLVREPIVIRMAKIR